MTVLHAVQLTVFPQLSMVSRERRHSANGHGGAVRFFTGLSGSGKSSVAHVLEAQLFSLGHQVIIVDGDNIRAGLCADLAFDVEGRAENLRRTSEVLQMFVEAGVIVLATFVAPVAADRARLRARLDDTTFVEIFCDCPIEVCETRDVKGLCLRPRSGEIVQLTGVSAPYEAPLAPDLRLCTDLESLEASARSVSVI
ncbi:adenylyl-sulfate kinase [Massilia sp. PWRC2]|uniref:adenylyl-sulfate kinase n=1 Tax=Massilia sp. PWRC2 TaxID=2804626 RepID=UPI003CECDE07